jgi:hypothetical protein
MRCREFTVRTAVVAVNDDVFGCGRNEMNTGADRKKKGEWK